jgi:hypothetical protein
MFRSKAAWKAYRKRQKAAKDELDACINHTRKRAPGSDRYCALCLERIRTRTRARNGSEPYRPHTQSGGKPPLYLRGGG